MRTMQKFLVGACAAAALVMASGTDVEAACSRVVVKGEGLTKEIARDMAKMNLEFAAAAKGAKVAGKAAYKCGTSGPMMFASCTARQRACT